MKKTGGELIVEALKANGVKRLSCVPGESFLATAISTSSSAARRAERR
jgi:thiamine pyrophosphate-dependent acetolactate synthase large subunit-like protein